MDRDLERSWRLCATALCFSTFGAGGLLLRALVFPTLALLVREPRRRAWLARRIIAKSFRAFISMMRVLGVISYEVHGIEKLQRHGLLVLANHPSLIDVVFLMAYVERANCIVKTSLLNNLFTRGPVRAAGFVPNDSGPELVERCIASVRSGSNLIIFPEGTRTPADGRMRLKRGAANVAVRGGIDITPVRILVTPPTLGKGEKWYRVARRRAHFRLDVGDDVSVREFIDRHGSATHSVRHLNAWLASYFQSEAPNGAA